MEFFGIFDFFLQHSASSLDYIQRLLDTSRYWMTIVDIYLALLLKRVATRRDSVRKGTTPGRGLS